MAQRTRVFVVCLVVGFWPCLPAWAWDIQPSFSEWRDTIEKAFKILQAQESKLLDRDGARSFAPWPRAWRTAVEPDAAELDAAKHRDPGSVEVVMTCRKALMSGVALWLKAKGAIPSGDTPIGLSGDTPYDVYAKTYIKFAETCEDGLHLPHVASELRRRFQ